MAKKRPVLKKMTYTNDSQQVISVARKNATSKSLLEGGVLTEEDVEMDRLVKESVKAAIRKAKTCGKPIAVFDKETGKAYLVYEDGRKVFVG